MKKFIPHKSSLLKLKELSKIIPYSESWLRLKVKHNLIPYYKVGRNLLFDYEEVMQVLRSKRIASASEEASKIQSIRRINNRGN